MGLFLEQMSDVASTTPAMAAGLIDHIGTVQELLTSVFVPASINI